MLKLIKYAVKELLNKYNYKIGYKFYDKTILGLDLNKKIKAVVKTEKPICFNVGANSGQTIKLFK